MGSLIQTKGTRYLATYLNGQFGTGVLSTTAVNLNWMRNQAGLMADFASTSGSASLFDLAEKYIGAALLVLSPGLDGRDLFYPFATAPTTSAGATTTLNFSQALGSWVSTGTTVWDATTPGAIPAGITVSNISANRMVVTISNPGASASLTAGDRIVFSDSRHANLVRRWRFFLKNELLAANHDKIRDAIYEALLDSTFDHISVSAIEDAAQTVHSNTEYDVSTTLGPLTTKLKTITLLTPRTMAPGPIDSQF